MLHPESCSKQMRQMQQEYAFSQRPACGLMLAASSYLYQSRRSDEQLRTRTSPLRSISDSSRVASADKT